MGTWFMFGKEMDGTMWLRSRTKSTVTKDYSDKIEWVPHIKEEMKCIPNGTVLSWKYISQRERRAQKM